MAELGKGDQALFKLSAKEQNDLMWKIILELPEDDKKSASELANMVPTGWSRGWENVARGILVRAKGKGRTREDGAKLIVTGNPYGERGVWRMPRKEANG